MRIELLSLTSNSKCIFEDEPGKLYIKRRKPSILVGSLFKLTIRAC